MGGISAIYHILLVNPTINFLLLFLFLFTSWHIPGAFGWAIIALTVFIRLLLNPLFAKQMQTAKDIELMRPKLDALNKKYKDDKQRLQQEQLKLYQENGINPASGCVTGLIQIPIFIALYQVLQMFLTNGGGLEKVVEQVNKVAYIKTLQLTSIDPWFFGFNLAVAPSHFQQYGFHYLAIPLVTAALQFYQISLQSPVPPKSKDKEGPEDMQVTMAKQMRIMFPLMIGYFSYILPVGLALYWNIFSLFGILNSKQTRSWSTKKQSDN